MILDPLVINPNDVRQARGAILFHGGSWFLLWLKGFATSSLKGFGATNPIQMCERSFTLSRLVDLTAWMEMVSRPQVDAAIIEDARRLIRATLTSEEQR